MARKRLIDVVEEEATEVFGRGTAISVDRSPLGGWRVQVWNVKGSEVLKVECQSSKDEAIRRMQELVSAKGRDLLEAVATAGDAG